MSFQTLDDGKIVDGIFVRVSASSTQESETDIKSAYFTELSSRKFPHLFQDV